MLVENIQSLCSTKNITLARLERELGFGNGTLKKWGTCVPGIDKVRAVADYFKISIDELLERGVYSLSTEAQEYAIKFDTLSDEKKQLAAAYMGVVIAQ